MKKSRLILATLTTLFVGLALFSPSVSADSRTAWGTRDASYYGDDDLGYHRVHSGATWYYYTISDRTSYSEDDNLYVPFCHDFVTKTAIPAKTCQGYGGFWVLLRNEYRKTSDTTGELTSRPASAIHLSDVYYSGSTWPATNSILYKDDRTGTPSDSNGNGVSASSYGTMTNVLANYNSVKNTTAVPDDAKNNIGNLSYFCYGSKRPAPANFTSFSTVSLNEGYTSAPVLNGDGYLADPIVVPTGSTVSITFKHYLAKSVENALSPNTEINYSLRGDGPTSSGNVSTAGLNTRYYINGGNYYALDAPVESKIENVQVNSTVTYCQVATFNSSSGRRYSLENYSIVGGGGQIRSGACVTLQPAPSTSETVSSCTQGSNSSTYISNSVLGDTAATVGITVNGVLKTTRSDGVNEQIKVYTRPGDIVQYSYAMCFGAHEAKVGNEYITRKTDQNNPVFNDFTVVVGDGKNTENESEFLFGRNNDLLDQTIYINNEDARNDGAFSGRSLFLNRTPSDRLNDTSYADFNAARNELLFASPDNKPKTTSVIHYFEDDEEEEDDDEVEGLWYDCAYYANYNLASAYNKSTGGYQIPGFQNVAGIDCDSAGLRKMNEDGNPSERMTSMVGSTLSQSLIYSDVMAWPSYLTNGRSTIGPLYDVSQYQGNFTSDHRAGPEYFARALDAYRSGYTMTANGSSGVASSLEVTKTASAITPYNFETNLSSSITNHDSATVYSGDIINISADVDILPRVNPLVESSDGKPYATITPLNTRVELIELLIPDTVNLEDKFVYAESPEDPSGTTLKDILNGDGQIFHKNTICNYFRNYLGDDYGECSSEIVKGRGVNKEYYPEAGAEDVGNNMSNPEGEMDYYHTDSLKRVVPDVEAGYKYCVLIGINHGDSHSAPGKELSTYPYLDSRGRETMEQYSGAYDSNGNPIQNRENPLFAANSYSVSNTVNNFVTASWGLSKASCRTVAKKPNFQAWNGGVYSNDIITSTTENTVNTKLTSNRTADSLNTNHIAPNASYFGSWAQYYVVAKGTVQGFASASSLGYSWNKGALTADGFSGAALGNDSVTRPNNFCILSRLTIANANGVSGTSCLTGSVGSYASIEADNIVREDFKDKILNFYTDDRTGVPKSTYSSVGASDYGDRILGAEYLKINNNQFAIDTPIIHASGTKVIHVLGHLDINANVCLDDGSGICSESSSYTNAWATAYAQNSNNLSLVDRNPSTYSSANITDLPQVIIIAESISISSEVSQIDAWLITDTSHSFGLNDGGYINTCREFQDSKTSTNTCWKSLKINGPVVTSALLLNRTGGAWPGISGDVGNPAYENLEKELDDIVSNQSIRNSFREQATQYCSSRISSATCIDNRIDYLIKEDFLARIEATYGEAARKAYENAGNYSANSHTVAAGNSSSRDLSCDGSITPAEIFDLHPFTYLWAYGQSQKAAQAIITYSEELSPRY